jgi:hypothetical protein
LDGEDQSTAFFGQPTVRQKPLLWEYGRNEESFKYPAGRDKTPNVALRDGPWKLLINADGSGAELYNVLTDSAESTNVAAAHPDILKRLIEQALAWRTALPRQQP